jgi:hypothetical protein
VGQPPEGRLTGLAPPACCCSCCWAVCCCCVGPPPPPLPPSPPLSRLLRRLGLEPAPFPVPEWGADLVVAKSSRQNLLVNTGSRLLTIERDVVEPHDAVEEGTSDEGNHVGVANQDEVSIF